MLLLSEITILKPTGLFESFCKRATKSKSSLVVFAYGILHLQSTDEMAHEQPQKRISFYQ